MTMTFKIICEMCLQELDEPGGLLFSPLDRNGLTTKIHVCKNCFSKVWRYIEEKELETKRKKLK